MRKRRGTAREASDLRKQMGIFEPGDTVTSVLAGSLDFIGSVTRIDKKVAKIFVNWGDGTEAQCSPDEIQLLPYHGSVDIGERFSRIARRGRLSEDIPGGGDQFVGDPKTHGIDKPRGGGFSIMQNLQKDLAPESKEEAKGGPLTASVKTAGVADRIADVFARFLIGDRKAALMQIRSFVNAKIGPWNTDSGEYNKEYSRLVDRLKKVIKAEVKIASEGRRLRSAAIVETVVTRWEDDGAISRTTSTDWDAESGTPEGDGNLPVMASRRDCMEGKQDSDFNELRSRRALYWGGPGRKYRQTKSEQTEGACSCPKCKGEMEKQPFTKSERLYACPGCGFKVPSGSLTTKKIEIEIAPDGKVEVEVEPIEGSTRRGRMAEEVPSNLKQMSISDIAFLISQDWRNVKYTAKPYLEAMYSLGSVNDTYIMDSGKSIVARFLSNSSSWRGDIANAVKAELKRRLR